MTGTTVPGFRPLGLSVPIHNSIRKMGFKNPTPVQRKAIPVVLSGVDVLCMARTGSGKTCAFLWPTVEKLLSQSETANDNNNTSGSPSVIVLSPTRELSLQTLNVLHKIFKATGSSLRAIGIHGAESMERQFAALATNPDVIVATPGRLAHHLEEIPDFHISGCRVIILDEADRLLEMGFATQLRQICKKLPASNCQKLLFSATLPSQLVEFSNGHLFDAAEPPALVRLDAEVTVSAELRTGFFLTRSAEKDAALLAVLEKLPDGVDSKGLILIFVATRHHVEYLSTLLTAANYSSTFIYGSLDTQARQENLRNFRHGNTPILIVTDVAARGIDVPLIDHVIHYHFPADPKLFVHRSGRAARAGRLGYAWGLVDPDELPYLWEWTRFHGHDAECNTEARYSLAEMDSTTIHYGSIPNHILSPCVERVLRLRNGSSEIVSLLKVCGNAMKQYRRTRREASSSSVRKAKAVLEGAKSATGERKGGTGVLATHPLFAEASSETATKMKAHEDFLRAVSSFRPKETVFEAFGTSGGKGEAGVVSHVDKGRTTARAEKNSSVALKAMKSMRRQMRLARDSRTLVVAGSTAANVPEEPCGHDSDAEVTESAGPEPIQAPVDHSKRRLSRAERKRLKKHGAASLSSDKNTQSSKKAKTGFRDPLYYMSNEFADDEATARLRDKEATLQPSFSSGRLASTHRLQQAMLDVVGDEREEMVQKQRLMRWSKAKRKYVPTTIGAELSGDSTTKKIRLESGQLVKQDRSKLGELYSAWQKKTNRSVGRTGVFDEGGPVHSEPTTSRPRKGGKKGVSKDSQRSEIKSTNQIYNERVKKQNLRVKNMKKTDRRKLEHQEREHKNSKARKEWNKSAPKRHR